MEYYEKSLNITDDKELKVLLLNNIGVIHDRKGKIELSRKFFKEVLEIQREILENSNADVAKTYSNLGALCFMENNLDDALDMFKNSLRILKKFEEHGDDVEKANIAIGTVYMSKGDNQTAELYIHAGSSPTRLP